MRVPFEEEEGFIRHIKVKQNFAIGEDRLRSVCVALDTHIETFAFASSIVQC